MKLKMLLALSALGGAVILSASSARADLVAGPGALSVAAVRRGGDAVFAGNPRTIFHVYANFTSGSDRVLTWGIGGASFGAGGIENITRTGAPGMGFTNVGGSTQAPPPYPSTFRDWDSYATLGVRYGDQVPAGSDAPAYSPDFPTFITGQALDVPAAGMAVFISPDPANVIGRADFINESMSSGDVPDNPQWPADRVLLMQLVVNQGEHVRGTIGMVWDGAGAPDGMVVSGLVFNSVPAPGTVALLGLAHLQIRSSRRRRE